jgi:DNA ligase D-like protein (predicted ligase)
MQKAPVELRFVPPMECKEVKSFAGIPRGPEWQYEIKFDGFRAIAVKQQNDVTIFSRSGKPFTQFGNLYDAVAKLPGKSIILDGEICALDENGRSNFNALQNIRTRPVDVHFYVFDFLHWQGANLLELPLAQRQQRLWNTFKDSDHIHYPIPLNAELERIILKIREYGFEGIIAKERDSIYIPGKSPGTWIKKKLKQSAEFIIGGYIPGRNGVDEILVGEFENKKFNFVEDIDDGFVPATRRQVFEAVKKLETDKCPFANLAGPQNKAKLDREKLRQVHWLKPKVVTEISFNERTPNNHLRHGEFKRLRPDKAAR